MLSELKITFEESDCIFNVLSKAVLAKDATVDTLNNHEIGKEMYQGFVEQRIKGSTSVWAKLKKRKLKTFQTQSYKVGEKIVQIKEERSLVTRFLIMSHRRDEIDLRDIIGNYELSVVPQALFLQDGKPYPYLDKSKVTVFSFVCFLFDTFVTFNCATCIKHSRKSIAEIHY